MNTDFIGTGEIGFDRANKHADKLPDVIVLNGNSTASDWPGVEGILNTVASISVTDAEKSDIIS